MSDATLSADAAERLYMQMASDTFVDALTTGVGPQAFAWRDRIIGVQPSEEPREYRTIAYRRVMQSIANKEAALARAVSRDPCPVCGTRMDVGCKHRRIG